MYWRYRRNADEDIRDLERRFYEGDPTILPRLVNHYVRSNSLSISFLLEHPEAFNYLPAEYQQRLQIMTGAIEPPPPAPSASSIPHGVEYDDEEEEEDEEEEDPHQAEIDAGDYWECANCGRDLFEDDMGEEWALLSEAAAELVSHRIGRGEPGQGMCHNCLNQADLDVESATEDDLSDYYYDDEF